jgi:predicted nucleic-acid-binding protein
MIGIDTNVLVRYLTDDDEIQSKQASNLINRHAAGQIFINNIVLCELIWVLERGYEYSKTEVITVLRAICTTMEFVFEDHNILWLSILEYEKATVDFSDILLGKINMRNRCIINYTFDRAVGQLSIFKLVE